MVGSIMAKIALTRTKNKISITRANIGTEMDVIGTGTKWVATTWATTNLTIVGTDLNMVWEPLQLSSLERKNIHMT